MHKCILCSNTTTKPSSVTYHAFPRNLVRRNQWVEHLKMDKCFDWQRVCSDHFSSDDYKPGEKRLLRSHAIPKIPTNDIHENMETLESSDLVNNTANRFSSPRRSNRKKKKTRQLIENENSKTMGNLPTPNVAPIDSRARTPISNSIANRKMNKKKVREGFIGVRFFQCTVKSCKNSYPGSNVSFFSYPESSLRDVWIENCGSQEIIDAARSKKKKHLKVCGKHFEKSMFVNPNKRNRLIQNAIPTIRINRVCNTSQSDLNQTFENNDMEYTSIEESSSTNEYLPSVELEEIMTDEANIISSTKIFEICCVPGCISNFAEDSLMPDLLFLFGPAIEDINKWSLTLGIPLAESSRVCELHFKPQDFSDSKSLKPGTVPSVITPCVDDLNFLSDRAKKKYELQSSTEEPKKRLKFEVLPEDVSHSSFKLNEESTNILPGTMINNSSSYISQSSPIYNDQTSIVTYTENDTNSILKPLSEKGSEPIPKSIPSADESGSRPKQIFSNNSVSISNISQSNHIHDKHTSVINITEVDTNSILRQSSERTVDKPILSTSAYESSARIQKMLSNSSVSITMESSDEHNKQLLPVNSTEIINTSILKQTLITEPTGVLSKASTSSSTPQTSQSNLIQMLPKAFTNGSVSITLKSNINPSEIDSADIVKPTSLTENSMSNSVESTLKNLVNNNSVSITREPSCKQKKPISTMNSTDVFKSPSVSVLALKRKPGTTDIPSTSTNDSSLTNVNISEELSLSDNLANPISRQSVNQLDISQQEMKLESMGDYECPITSTGNFIMTNLGVPISMTSNINNNVEMTTLIREISKTVELPNLYWRCLHHREKQNNIVFIERNELMEPVKKIYFKNSLVPMIYINNKRYEYNETIDNKIALENLLSKIDEYQICLGYDGFIHNQCIGYLDSASDSDSSEICNRCSSLVEKDFFSKYDSELTKKIDIIKNIKKSNMEIKHRISEAKKRLQSKRKDPKNIYKSSSTKIYKQ